MSEPWLHQIAHGTLADWTASGDVAFDGQLISVEDAGQYHFRVGDGVTPIYQLPNHAEKGDKGDPGTTQTGAEIVALINAEIGTDWQTGGGGGGASPTQTVVSVSGASVSVPIPVGCKWFSYSGPVTLSSGAANIIAELYGDGDTVQRLSTGYYMVISTAAYEAPQTSSGLVMISTGSGNPRHIAGTIMSPRDSAIRTAARGDGAYLAGTAQWCNTIKVGDTATDDDTLRIFASAGTMTGDIVFTWF